MKVEKFLFKVTRHEKIITTPVWTDTLTYDIEPAGRTWAFSPNQNTINQRGYAYNRTFLTTTAESFTWNIWVRGN